MLETTGLHALNEGISGYVNYAHNADVNKAGDQGGLLTYEPEWGPGPARPRPTPSADPASSLHIRAPQLCSPVGAGPSHHQHDRDSPPSRGGPQRLEVAPVPSQEWAGPVTAGPRPRARGVRTGGAPRLPQVQAGTPSQSGNIASPCLVPSSRPSPGGRVRGRVWPGSLVQARGEHHGARSCGAWLPDCQGPPKSPSAPRHKPEDWAWRSLHESKRTPQDLL